MKKRSTELIGLGRFKIREGKLEEYIRLTSKCIEIARTKDTGTLQYEIFFNDDKSEVMFVERYSDSAALLTHVTNIGSLMGAILETVIIIHGELLGEPDADLRLIMAENEYPHLFTNRLTI